MNSLMYIHNPSPERLVEPHARIAELLGFSVVGVLNRDYAGDDLDPFELLGEEDLVGVWVDVPHDQTGVRTQRIVVAAHEAGKRLLGFQYGSDETVARNIIDIIGKPEPKEVPA